MNERVLEENLTALLRAADDRLSPSDVDRACASFLGRIGREPGRPRPWLALASAAAVLVAVLGWGLGVSRGPGGQAELDRWITELAHEDAGVRDRAARALGDLGLDLFSGLAALEKPPALPDLDARERARRVARALRDGVGLPISHQDGPAPRPAPQGSKLRLELYDVADLLERNERTGEDLAQLIKANVLPEAWSGDEVGMSFDQGILTIRNSLDVHHALRSFLSDLRSGATPAPSPSLSRPGIEERIRRLGSADRAERDSAEASLRDLGLRYAYALGAIGRLRSSPDADLRLRADELRTSLLGALAPLFSHHALRRAAVERIRKDWPGRNLGERAELVQKAFEPCVLGGMELYPDLSKGGLRPEALLELGRGEGIVSLWKGVPFSFRTLGAHETTLVFTIPGDPVGCVAVRFER